MFWLIVNALAFVGTPAGLIWGWVSLVIERQDHVSVRKKMSLIALSAASLTLAIFLAARFIGSGSRTLDRVGVFVAVASILVSLSGRLRLVIPVCLVSVGAIMIWFGTTVR